MKVLLLDNYDSFTYNLKHLLERYVENVEVRRNDEIGLAEVEQFDRIVLSPGPGLPGDAGIMPDLVARYAALKPMLGVCLGLQCIVEVFGGRLKNLDTVVHGVATEVDILSTSVLFDGMGDRLTVGHYHSWVADKDSLPDCFSITATDSLGEVMAIRHKEYDVCAVQFHPESVLTPRGHSMISNWLGVEAEFIPSFPVNNGRINIAIDGHSACGKSTVSKILADRLGYIYIDSGAMYRAMTLFALDNGLAEGKEVDHSGLVAALDNISIGFHRHGNGEMRITLNGQDVESQIRTMRVSKVVSPVSTIPEVRKKLVDIQKELGQDKGVVMDGRDIGTAVFPDAELKLFLTASVEERSRRRWAELAARGTELSMAEVMENVLERDMIDSTRKVSPLIQAEEAVVIDTSTLTIEQTLSRIESLVEAEMA